MRQIDFIERWRSLPVVLLFIIGGYSSFAQNPIWSDEFDGTELDKSKWLHEAGGTGNGNGELQYYTATTNNTYIENGNLVLEAKRESYEGKQFTSARIKTHGRFSFKYGTLEARIKLPNVANGLWPAFWMMGDNIGQVGWPKCGETDIMEVGWESVLANGTANQTVSGAVHWWQESGTWSDWLQADHAENVNIGANFYDDYHTFKVEWTPTYMNISVDGNVYFSQGITEPDLSEFVNNPNFIILNLAVGGSNFVNITDPNAITAAFPAKMYVDYVRLYENEFTEVFTEEVMAHAGPYGVFTEMTATNDQLNFGTSTTNLYIWNNMTPVTTAPAEGSGVFSYSVAPGGWWGMGLSHLDQNMKNYKNGYLHFQCKTTYQGTINVSIASSGADGSGVDLIVGQEEYGLIRDGAWHEVAIPLYKYKNVDFNTIKALFAVSGGDPGTAMEIAFDDIYWTESIELPTPEFGSYGVYTETAANMTSGTFGFGVSGDLFIWDSTLDIVPTTPSEGNSSLSFASTGKGWYGLGLTARVPHNLTAFKNGNGAFHFSMKTSSTSDFRVGMKSGNVDNIGQSWIWFKNGQDPYGFVRDGQWHDITIPINVLAGDVDLINVSQLFQFLGIGEIADIAFDNIYFSGGTNADDPGTNEKPINRPPSAAITASVSGGPAPLAVSFDGSQSFDVNGDALTYAWNFGDGVTATGITAQHTFTQNGSYKVTLTVADSLTTDETTFTVFVDDNFGRSKSAKRGVGYGQFSEADMAAMAPGISWWYNWGTTPESAVANVHLNYGVDYVPMAWNAGFNESQITNWLSNHPEAKYILGWNEPNFLEQGNLTPTQAAANWPRLEAIANQFNVKIVSPAMNYCGGCVSENGKTYNDPILYMDDFFAACQGCQVDAIAIHSYMGWASALEWYVGLFKKYNRPIWLTEFCNWENNPTIEDQTRYMVHAVDYLENDPDVEKYAWFIARHSGAPWMSLLESQSGVLTPLGQIYVNMPVHDPAVFYNVPGLIEAENYATMNGVRPQVTQDANGFLNLHEVAAGDWADYKVTAASGGTYEIDLRVASDSIGGTINILVDGVQRGSVNFGVTGGEQVWVSKKTTISIPAGNHTIRLAATQGWFGINNFKISTTVVNVAPIANAGADQTLANTATSVILNGSASTDPDNGPNALTYLWSKVSGPASTFSSTTIANPTVTGLTAGNTYVFQLIVNDGTLASTADQVSITVSPASSGCGTNTNIALNLQAVASSVQGDYTAVKAFDGNVGSRWGSNFTDNEWIRVDLTKTYKVCQVNLQWEGAYGKDYEIRIGATNDINASTVIATVTNGDGGADVVATNSSIAGQYLWMKGILRGTGYGYSLWEMTVYGTESGTVNQAPTANAGADKSLTAGTTSTTLTGIGSDPDGNALTYAWTKVSGPAATIVNSTSATTSITGLVNGASYTFRLVVNDGIVNSPGDDVLVTVANPTSGCGTTNVALNKTAVASSIEGNLTAASAFDGNAGTRWGSAFNDNEWIRVDLGQTSNVCKVTLQWEGAYGKNYEIRIGATTDINASSVIATVTNGDGGQDIVSTNDAITGRYLWMKGVLRGTAWGYSLWEMTVNAGTVVVNTAPIANAGIDQNLSATSTVANLTGSGTDAEGNALTYSWTKTSGSAATIVNPTAANTQVTGLSAGNTYTFQLVVNDGQVNSAADAMTITVAQPVVDCSQNVALNKAAVSSSQEGAFAPTNAVDASMGSRWASSYTNDEWLRIDLGSSHKVCQVVLTWENAYGKDYTIRIGNSTDLNASTVIATVNGGNGGEDIVQTDQTVAGRYIWMRGITRGTGWGYSLYDMKVFGSASSGARSISEQSSESSVLSAINVYPNPVSHTLNIHFDAIEAGDYVEVISVSGQRMMKQFILKNNPSIDVHHLETGMYILRYAGSRNETIRFIKL